MVWKFAFNYEIKEEREGERERERVYEIRGGKREEKSEKPEMFLYPTLPHTVRRLRYFAVH